MPDSRDSDVAVLAITVVVVLVLLAAGGAVFMWQRQQTSAALQEALARREQAMAEAVRARAAAEQSMSETAQPDPAVSQSPSRIVGNPDSIEASIRKVLQTQQSAWNAGDIERFMDAYWKSEDLTFSSGGKLTRSWRDTLENYKQRYPSRDDMGTLSFLNLEVTALGRDAALVLGEWQLRRETKDLRGNFTLVFRRLGDDWVIIHDHTSRTEQP